MKLRRVDLRRIAAFVAMWALALNVTLGAFSLCRPAATVDAFGEPICSHHTDDDAGQQPLPSAPHDCDGACCQCCGTLPLTVSAAAPLLPIPAAVEWKWQAISVGELSLPPPSRHLIGPPRGPPAA